MEINQISSFEFQLKMDRKHEIFWNLEKFRIWNSAIAKFFRKLKLFFSFFFFFHQEKISTNFVTTTFVLVSFFRRFKESKVNFRMKIFLIKLYNIKYKINFHSTFYWTIIFLRFDTKILLSISIDLISHVTP